jgi:ATP-dependent Lon protease
VKVVVFPEKNRVDLENLDQEIRGDMQVVLCSSVEEVIDLVLK